MHWDRLTGEAAARDGRKPAVANAWIARAILGGLLVVGGAVPAALGAAWPLRIVATPAFGRGSPAFFVAPNGSDGNAGTIAAPFATLGKCQTAMERSATKTCYVRGGYYAPAPSSATASGCHNGGAVANLVKLTHAGGDDGKTFSY